ncbi:kinesin-like protein KIF22-B [Neodiprion lecontei]|uniref:Kinesin-like protein KIF22-B n=2 Tax=Neodiprion TaxID=270857 RepID=A0A6J0BJW8_NEOLC|nr:kinesin-like protein KIF22-B [Neodiprion lecontei]
MDPEIHKKESNLAGTDFSRDNGMSTNEGKILLNNNFETDSAAKTDEETQRIDNQWKKTVFGSKRKLDSLNTQDEESDMSSERLGKTSHSTVRKILKTAEKKYNANKSHSSGNHNTSGVNEATHYENSETENDTKNNQQAKRIQRRRKSIIFSAKKKINFSKNKDSDESADEVSNKLSRRKYKVKNLSKQKMTSNIDVEKSDRRLRHNKLKLAGNSSKVNYESKTEDTDVETETQLTTVSEENRVMNSSLTEVQSTHNSDILKLLNQGSPKELESLARIGPKTAMMLDQYRKLNGKLETIRDLENMPGWSPRVFKQFLSANNIVLD